MRLRLAVLATFLLALGLLAPAGAHAGATLDAIRARGTLRCGASSDTTGYGTPDSNGVLQGIDVDYCRALAAAIFGDKTKVTFVNSSTVTRFTVLQSGDIDVLFKEVTVLFNRDTQLGLIFGPVYVYDGQELLVPKKLGAKSIADLDGANVCVVPGSNSELNIADYFRTHNMKYTPISIDNADGMRRAFFGGQCDVFTGDSSMLAANRAGSAHPDDYTLLPETLAKSPLAPMVRQGDDQWLNIVKWVVYATFIAEEKKITQANVDQVKQTSTDPEVMRLLGKTPGLSKQMGLDDNWAYNVIKTVGNYGEIYERNLGAGSTLKLPRTLNRQWYDGGLIYAPPFL